MDADLMLRFLRDTGKRALTEVSVIDTTHDLKERLSEITKTIQDLRILDTVKEIKTELESIDFESDDTALEIKLTDEQFDKDMSEVRAGVETYYTAQYVEWLEEKINDILSIL